MPFNDSAVITVALPTPDGMTMMMAAVPTSTREIATQEMETVCNFVYFSYTGSLAQWHAFLDEGFALPATLADLILQVDYSRGLSVKSSRFRMQVPVTVLKIDADSVLMLKYSFMREGAGTAWDLGGVYLSDSEHSQKWVGLVRREKPSPDLPEEATRLWRTMTTGLHPWDFRGPSIHQRDER